MGDNADVTAHAHTLGADRTSLQLAVYIPFLEGGLRVVHLFAVGGRAQLGRRVEDLTVVLDSEAIDIGEGCGKILSLVGSEVKAVDHVGELRVGKRSVVDDSAVGFE